MTKNANSLLNLLKRLPSRRNEPAGTKVIDPVDLQTYLPFRFHRLSVLLAKESSELVDHTGSSDLKIRDWRLMVLLASLGPLTNREITELANMPAPTISRAMTSLTKLGFVVSGTDPDDKRKTVMSLTKEGGKIYNRLAKQRVKSAIKIGAMLSKEDREILIRIFDQIEQKILKSSNDKPIQYDWDDD